MRFDRDFFTEKLPFGMGGFIGILVFGGAVVITEGSLISALVCAFFGFWIGGFFFVLVMMAVLQIPSIIDSGINLIRGFFNLLFAKEFLYLPGIALIILVTYYFT